MSEETQMAAAVQAGEQSVSAQARGKLARGEAAAQADRSANAARGAATAAQEAARLSERTENVRSITSGRAGATGKKK